jgi:hypothetical protein
MAPRRGVVALAAGSGPAVVIVQVLPEGGVMIVLGIILLVLGFVFSINILWVLGIILLVVGAILALLGATGRAVGGRKYWY